MEWATWLSFDENDIFKENIYLSMRSCFRPVVTDPLFMSWFWVRDFPTKLSEELLSITCENRRLKYWKRSDNHLCNRRATCRVMTWMLAITFVFFKRHPSWLTTMKANKYHYLLIIIIMKYTENAFALLYLNLVVLVRYLSMSWLKIISLIRNDVCMYVHFL